MLVLVILGEEETYPEHDSARIFHNESRCVCVRRTSNIRRR